MQYWRHRLGHRVSWWWQIHRFHHSATEFNVITEGRIHPLDIALNSLFVYIPLSLIGLNIETFILIKALCSLQSKLQHSMIPWRGGWIGRYLLIFPVDHRIHHSSQRVHWDKNYGHITPLWDRLFGTWYEGECINQQVGVTGNRNNQKGFLYDLWSAQIKFFNYLLGKKWSFKYGVIRKDA